MIEQLNLTALFLCEVVESLEGGAGSLDPSIFLNGTYSIIESSLIKESSDSIAEYVHFLLLVAAGGKIEEDVVEAGGDLLNERQRGNPTSIAARSWKSSKKAPMSLV